MDFLVLRQTLRTARKQVVRAREGRRKPGFTLDEAATATGLNRATIHSIENVKREPDLKPELETIEKLVYAYGMTLSSFFAQIEGLSRAGQPTQDAPDGARDSLPAPSAEDIAIGPEARERLTEIWLALGTIVAPPRRAATLERPAAGDRS